LRKENKKDLSHDNQTMQGSRYSWGLLVVAVLLLADHAFSSRSVAFSDPDVKGTAHHPIRQKSAPSPLPAKSLECTLCDLILKVVDDQLTTNSTDEEILQLLNDACLIFDAVSSVYQEVYNYGSRTLIMLTKYVAVRQTREGVRRDSHIYPRGGTCFR